MGHDGSHDSSTERHQDLRALRFAVIFPVLLCLGMVVGGIILSPQLPDGVVLPTGGDPLGLPAFLAVAVAVTLVVGIGVGSQGARTVLSRTTRRILLGLAMALQLASSAVFSAALLGQSAPGPAHADRVDGYVVLMGTGLAAAMGVVLALTFKPDEQWTSSDDAALAAILEHEKDPTAIKDQYQYVLHPRSSVIIMILLAGVLPGALLAILSPWFLLILPLAALLVVAGLCATVRTDRSQLSVKLAGVLPVITVPCTEIEGALSLDIVAKDYGGVGLRRHSGRESFLPTSGAGVVLGLTHGRRAVVGAPTLEAADELAIILNRRAGKTAGQR
ncbi:hypothetical protein [Arthrobacter cryoconiti]|uniref:DUF1648 domain-containing protein n=1 Tax=Arthrobacter cryoconiti TaxID=748907 RepID=A0ABV8R123_9MICC|nr:hypothetical protein [Arthrobacter cryoconiti]MCC9068553.1 hypothetical protein [Arthrobacter cryoconiti]